VLAREPYLGKVALILAQIDKNEYKEVTIPAPWNKRVSFREIFIKNNYVNLNPGMTSFNIKPLLPDLSVKEIIIVHNLDLEYNAAVHLFFNIFYWLQLRGIDINKNEFLTKEDLFLAAENKNLNDKSILYTKLTYKAWRNLYVEATAVYEDELSQARYFAQRYGEVVLAFKRWHEIVHLTQDEYGNLVNNEYEALMAELVLGSHFLNSLSMDFDNFFNMGEALPKEYQTAFTKLFVTVARAYQNSKENREMRVLESTVDELIHNLKGVDECSDKDISLIIEKIRENFVEEVHSW
jgi:hypothetical protein